MSFEQAGAIIRIIFYILYVNGKEKSGFDPAYISSRYNEFLNHSSHREKIRSIIKKSKKNNGKDRIKTLEKKVLIQQWLNKHTTSKRILWFTKCDGMFKIKKEWIRELRGSLIRLNINECQI